MLNKYLFIALLVGALIAFTGIKGFEVGKKVERSAWQKKELAQITQAAEQLKQLHTEARAKESLATIQLQNITDQLIEAQNEIQSKEAAINKLHNDVAKLWLDPLALQACNSKNNATAASVGSNNEETITTVSTRLLENVYAKFGECDAIVNQLTAAQEVIKLDREIINTQ